MKAKINSFQTPQPTEEKNKSQLLISFSIIITGLLIFTGIMIPTMGLPSAYSTLKRLVPKFPQYQKQKDISDYSNLLNIVQSQPEMSFNPWTSYYLVEVGGFDCVDCAKFHGYSAQVPFSFTKLKEDFIESGRVNYLWLDMQVSGDFKKNNSLYCVGEQDSKKFFDYRETLFKNYGSKFDLDTAKEYAKPLNLDMKKFEDCFNSNKYEDRAQKLHTFSTEILNSLGGGSFYLYKIEERPVKKIDGKTENQKVPSLIAVFGAGTDYDKVIKARLESVTN